MDIIILLSLLSLCIFGYTTWTNAYEYNTFAATVASIGGNENTIMIASEQAVTDDLIVPANITLRFLQGGSLNVSAGKVVTINGFIEAPPVAIFKGSGDVDINTSPIDAAWWEGGSQLLIYRGIENPLVFRNDGNLTVWTQTHSNTTQDNPTWKCQRGRGTDAVPLIVQNNDPTGEWTSYGWDGVQMIRTARIYMDVDGTPGVNDMPGRIDFEVTPAGGITPLVKMSLKNDGVLFINEKLGVGKTPDASIHAHIYHATEKVYLEIEGLADNATLIINSGTDGGVEESAIHLKDNSNNKWAIYKETDNTFIIYNYADTSIALQIQADGDVLLPSIPSTDAGDYDLRYDAAQGIVYDTSDIRQKKSIKPLSYGLTEILKLKPKSYNYYTGKMRTGKDGKRKAVEITKSSIKSFGLIAQEVYGIIPEAVYKPKDEKVAFWGLREKRLMPILINAIKELNNKIVKLER